MAQEVTRRMACTDRRPQASRHARGFTITELIVVMIIIVLLAGLAVKYVPDRIDEAKKSRTIADLAETQDSLEQYRLHVGDYPTQDQGLQALVEAPSSGSESTGSWRGPYLKKVPKDGWGRDLVYVRGGDGESFEIISYGKDGKEGGEGFNADISSLKDLQ